MTATSSTSSAPEVGALRILVVEDTMIVADEIKRLLVEIGYVVVGPLSSFEKAMEAVTSEEFDGALLDINLDGTPVFPVADVLLKRAIPVVFLTGYSVHSLPVAYRAMPCLEKPFARAEFASMMERVFGAPSANRR